MQVSMILTSLPAVDSYKCQQDCQKRVQSNPLICTSVISTLCLFAQRVSSPISVYAMSTAVNFAYKHQPYMHDSAISTHSFGPSAMNYFGCKQLGLHGAHKTTCSEPLGMLIGMPVTTSKPHDYVVRQS